MKQKIKNLKRRWRKLRKFDRVRIATFSILAISSLPIQPMVFLWEALIVFIIFTDIIQLRKEQYYYYCIGRSRNISIYMLRNRMRLLGELAESTNKYVDLLLKYNKLRAAHNKLLRRRRKENNQ